MSRLLLTGNEAFAHAALEAGVGVVAGHPGSSSSEVADTVARQMAKGRASGVSVEWSVSEKVALEVCAGAALSGLRALFTCQQAGLNVASDALSALNCVGVRGGLVLFVTDDPDMDTAPRWQDTRSFAEFAKVPLLDPATPEQGFSMMKQAFELSEAFGTPVIVRSTVRISQSSAFFDVEDATEALPFRGDLGEGFASYAGDGSRGFVHDPHRWVLAPEVAGSVGGTSVQSDRVREVGRAHAEIESRLRKIAHTFSFDLGCSRFNPISLNGVKVGSGAVGEHNNPREAGAGALDDGSRATIGIASGGEAAAVVLEALSLIEALARRAGIDLPDYKMIQVGTPFPFPRRAVMRFYKGLSDVLVLEELEPFIENELLKASGASFLGPNVHGRLSGEAARDGELSVEDAALRIARFFDDNAKPADDAAQAHQGPGGATRAESPAGAYGGYGSYMDEYVEYDDVFDDFDDADDLSDGFAPTPAEPHAFKGESKVKQRLAALQKHTTLVELVERAVGPDALYEFKGELPERPAVLCAGCPHRASLVAAKNAVSRLDVARSDVIFCGDVGCSALGVEQPLEAVDTSLCMGAGVSMAQGFAIANPRRKCVAFVGDDSFFSSGMAGVANAVWNGRDITIVVLNNMTTAACGVRPNAGSGSTLGGRPSPAINAEGVLRALGVEAVYHVDPLRRSDAEEACMRAIEFTGPAAVVMTSPCVYLIRNDKAAIVNMNKCTGCKKCIAETGCPAISFDVDARGAKSSRRGQAVIDAGQCNGCGLCVQTCPFQAIIVRKRDAIEDALSQAKARSMAEGGRVRASASQATAHQGSRGQAASGASRAGGADGGTGASSPAASAALEPEPRDEIEPRSGAAGRSGGAAVPSERGGASADADVSEADATSATDATDAVSAAAGERGASGSRGAAGRQGSSDRRGAAALQSAAPQAPSVSQELSLDSLFGGQVKIDLDGGDAS